MEKFQIELVVELIDQDLKWCENNLKRYGKVMAKEPDSLFYKQRMEEQAARIKNLKVIRNILIYGE